MEGDLILEDCFITQSAPDIRKKLQRIPLDFEHTLDNLLKPANKIFYNRDQEEIRRKDEQNRKNMMALVAALCEVNGGLSGERKHGSGLFSMCTKNATSKGNARYYGESPISQALLAKDITRRLYDPRVEGIWVLGPP